MCIVFNLRYKRPRSFRPLGVGLRIHPNKSVEDADIVSTASEFSKASTVLSAVQATTAKILSQSLLDFLD